jgi:putative cardiolipin synthase
VPGEAGTAALVRLAASGVKVRVLTNSFASTDVSIVHAGYAKRRCELVSAGVRLFELKASDGDAPGSARGFGSSSATRLHAKTFAVDGERVFVGSFNFDPRSARLNTEMGLVIDSRELAQRLATAFDREIPSIAYELRPSSADGCVEWIQHAPAGEIRHAVEPGTSTLDRAMIRALSVLPIDWLL